MNRYAAALSAGFAATVVLSVMMAAKAMMGVMPALDVAGMLAAMMGMPGSAALGWLAHLMIGTIGYGLVFAALYGRLPGGSAVMRGGVLGLIGWLVMMIVVMPMTGAGLFAMRLGLMAPMMTAVLHIIFGAVLGWTYAKLAAPAPEVSPA